MKKCNHYPVFGNPIWEDGELNPNFYVKRCTKCGFIERLSRHKKNVEFEPDSIKKQRETHTKALLQPFHEGELSKEYIEAYGTKSLNVTPDQAKKAKYVYKGIIPNWHNRHKTK